MLERLKLTDVENVCGGSKNNKNSGKREIILDKKRNLWITSNSTVTDLFFPGVCSIIFGANDGEEWTAEDSERLLHDAVEVGNRNMRNGVPLYRIDEVDHQTNITRQVSFLTTGSLLAMGFTKTDFNSVADSLFGK